MAHHLKVSEFLHTLPGEQRADYEELLRDPRATQDGQFDWLRAHGYDGGRTSVWRHRKRLEREPEARLEGMLKGMTDEKLRAYLTGGIARMRRSELMALVAFLQLWAKLRGRESSDSGGVRRQ